MANRLMNNTMVSEKKSLTNEKSNFFDRYGINGGGGIQLADTWMR